MLPGHGQKLVCFSGWINLQAKFLVVDVIPILRVFRILRGEVDVHATTAWTVLRRAVHNPDDISGHIGQLAMLVYTVVDINGPEAVIDPDTDTACAGHL